MITPITPDFLKEREFQSIIKQYLVENNKYHESSNSCYDKFLALDTDCLFRFLENTQEKASNKLKEIYGDKYRSKVLNNLNNNLKSRGSIDVINHGIKDYGVKLELAYFKPPTDFNPEQFELYNKNIVSVIEELNYEKDKRIDLVIFLNGIPIITLELKNSLTNQTYKNAIQQYKKDRSNREQLFKFKERAIVNFAVDTDEVYMTTKLEGKDTNFLPFNKGYNNGAGNPPVEGKLKTHYLWEDILKKDTILEILNKFTFVEKKKTRSENGTETKKETVIFPRYHQLDVVSKLLKDVKKNGSGHKYLIQHSAGSGKTKSITWLTHRLATLHNSLNELIFDGIIVITDRKVLDQQLQDSIYKIEHKTGLVAKIDENSNQLAREMEKETKIIISTIQKFPFILDKISGTSEKRYAIVIDEAHSSTSGKDIMALKESLSLDEAQKIAQREEEQEEDTEDKINRELEQYEDNSNISFFAFTATPKATTLKLFGVRESDGKYYPFHLYSMKQAIEEKFILDVLQYYMTYKMYYRVNKKIEDDPSFDKSKAKKSIVRYVSLHPENIHQKTEIIIEHFRNHTLNKIDGKAKAMVVTPSRLHAVRYKLAFDKYIREHNYSNLSVLVAFSGTVKDTGTEYRESQMNDGISQTKLPKEFNKDESKILIVANKYQTGFDQPKLHTMYVDKKLHGVKAVQTLSRLNRIYKGKEDTFVLDFVNDPEDIRESFLPFYKVTRLDNDIEPNDIYKLSAEIYDKQIIDKDDVYKFADIYFKEKRSRIDKSLIENYLNNSVERIKNYTNTEKIELRNLIRKFMNLYNLILQVAPFVDTEIHRLNIYLRFFIKKLDIESPGGIDITDKVVLQYYKLQNKTNGSINMVNEDGDDYGLKINISDDTKVNEPEKDPLSVIIEELNEKYGTEFSESERLAVEQIKNNLTANESLKIKAKNNSLQNFKYAFEKEFDNGVINEYSKNQDFYGKILKDEEFKEKLMSLMMIEVYNSFKSARDKK